MGLFFPSVAAAQGLDIEALLKDYKVVERNGRQLVEVRLKDMLKMVFDRSNALKSARLSHQIALSNLEAVRDRNAPTLTTKAEYGSSATASPTTTSVGGTTTNELYLIGSKYTTLSSEISKKTTMGITYGLKYAQTSSTNTVITASSGSESERPEFTSKSLVGTLHIPLIKDFGWNVGEIPLKKGEIGVEKSRLQTLQSTNQIVAILAGIYWRMVEILEAERVQEDSVRLSERLFRDNQERLRAGVLSPADVKVSETQLARDKQGLLQIQLDALRIEDQARAALNLENITYGFLPVDVPTLRETEFDFNELIKKARQNNPDFQLANAALKAAELDLSDAKNLDSTDLSLSLYYAKNDYQYKVDGLPASDLNGYGATLTWKLPLFDSSAEEKVRQKTMEKTQYELRMKDLESDITVKLQSALRSLKLARQEVETAKKSVSLAEELLQNEIERFKLGRSTSFRVAQSQQDAGQARRSEILARVGYERAYLDMLILTGDVFSVYGLPSPL